MTLRRWVVLHLAGVYLIGGCGSSGPDRADFQVGMSRQVVQARFGAPEHSQSMIKHAEPIWGPIETFWSTLDSGASVELWSYLVEGGAVELYFVDGDSLVTGMGFAPEGVVY